MQWHDMPPPALVHGAPAWHPPGFHTFRGHAARHAWLLLVHGGNTFAAFRDVEARAGPLLEGAGLVGPLRSSFVDQDKEGSTPLLFRARKRSSAPRLCPSPLSPVPAAHQSDEWTPFLRASARAKRAIGLQELHPSRRRLLNLPFLLIRRNGRSPTAPREVQRHATGPSPDRLLTCSLRCAPHSRRPRPSQAPVRRRWRRTGCRPYQADLLLRPAPVRG